MQSLLEAGTSIDRAVKPKISYHLMIRDALKDSFTGYLTLQAIYAHIQNKYQYYADRDLPDEGWKNSIRHNLSLLQCFEGKKGGG